MTGSMLRSSTTMVMCGLDFPVNQTAVAMEALISDALLRNFRMQLLYVSGVHALA